MIYLAAPLFNPIEREFNARLKRAIAYPVYLPQEDGMLLTELMMKGLELEAASKMIFQEGRYCSTASQQIIDRRS